MAGRIALNRPLDSHRVPNMSPEATEMGDTWDTVLANLNTMLTELFGGTSTVAGNKTYSGTQTFNNTITMQAGATGPASFKPAGNLTGTFSTIGSSATNTTQTLASYSLPPNTLDATGRMLEVTAWGHVAGNAAPKTILLAVGGATVSTGTQTGNGYAWNLNAYLGKSGANAQSVFFFGSASGGIVTQKAQTDTSVDTSTITISVTCADASAAQSNVFIDGFCVEYFE